MARSALSKVAWVGRTVSMVLGLALVMAMVLGVASVALAGNLDPLKIGSIKNVATKTTQLVGKVATGSAFVVKNPSGGSALGLSVGDPLADPATKTVAPMKVDSQAKVANLNADKIDGRDSADFAGASHEHSGADITSGAVGERHIDRSIARDGEIMPTVLAQDGVGSGVDADKIDGKEPGDFASAAAVHPPELVTLTPPPPSGPGTNPSILTKTLLANGTFSLVATCSVAYAGDGGEDQRFSDAKIEVQTLANDTTVVKGSFDSGSSSSTFDPPQTALLAHAASGSYVSADAGAFQASEPGGEALHGQFRAEQVSKDSTDPDPAQCTFTASGLG